MIKIVFNCFSCKQIFLLHSFSEIISNLKTAIMSTFEQKTTLSKTTVTRETAQPEVVMVSSINSVLTEPSKCPPSSCDTVVEKHHHEEKGIFDKIKEVFTGGDNPVNKAEKYAKKVSLCFLTEIYKLGAELRARSLLPSGAFERRSQAI